MRLPLKIHPRMKIRWLCLKAPIFRCCVSNVRSPLPRRSRKTPRHALHCGGNPLMQDASVERLSRIIGEPRKNSSGSGDNGRLQPRNTLLHVNLRLAEGWFSLFLLVTVVYSTIWSVQAAGWVDHLSILTLTTAVGLVG